jgi:flagellar biosynthesis protein
MAVALGYEPGRRAPEILARGAGLLAERILELAKAAGVPVRQDADLTEVLAGLDVGAEIPPELYEAVAEVLAFVYRMNEKYRQAVGSRQ